MNLAVDVDEVGAGPGSGETTGSGRGGILDTVWLHGFTQTSRSWSTLLCEPALADRPGRRFRVDLPGHGDSPRAEGDLWSAGRAVLDGVEAAGFATGVLVGYSLGGRTALHAALLAPSRWAGIVLIGATPGLSDPTAAAERREADARLGELITEIGVEAFVDRWLALPLFAGLRVDPLDRADRCRNTVDGLLSSLICCGTGTQEDLRGRLGTLTMPVLALAGARDEKFLGAAEEIATHWGGPARVVAVPDAGHSAHLEAPGAVAEILASWFEDLGGIS